MILLKSLLFLFGLFAFFFFFCFDPLEKNPHQGCLGFGFSIIFSAYISLFRAYNLLLIRVLLFKPILVSLFFWYPWYYSTENAPARVHLFAAYFSPQGRVCLFIRPITTAPKRVRCSLFVSVPATAPVGCVLFVIFCTRVHMELLISAPTWRVWFCLFQPHIGCPFGLFSAHTASPNRVPLGFVVSVCWQPAKGRLVLLLQPKGGAFGHLFSEPNGVFGLLLLLFFFIYNLSWFYSAWTIATKYFW